jgi:hypothetical protein
MLKKYFALTILISVLTYSCLVGFLDMKLDNPLVIQESETISSSVLGDLQPVDGDAKQKGHNFTYELLATLILMVTFSFNCIIQLFKRLTMLFPVFHQSNYLITSPSNLF